MRRTTSYIFLLLIVGLGVWLGANFGKLPLSKRLVNAPAPSQAITSPQPTPSVVAVSLPQKLIIPKLQVDAAVESVGMDQDGKMDVPKKAANVAWYNLGSKPGDPGSAVMAGHLDTVTGAPAVFYYITKLQKGDEIDVEDSSGKTLKFQVTHTAKYPYDQFPLQEVFATPGKPTLNLITCGGQFDNKAKNYSHRFVVYSEIVP